MTPSIEVRKAIEASGLFDANSYLASHADVRESGVDPLSHYLSNGYHEGRWPSRDFNPAGYLAANPDVAAAGIEPLTHYVLFGKSEGRAGDLSMLPNAYARRRARCERVKGQDFFEKFGFSDSSEPDPDQVSRAVSDLVMKDPLLLIDEIHPEVSIVIPIDGQLAFVLNCLDSIALQVSRYSVEIIVANDFPPDDILSQELQAIPWIRYHRREVNGGFIANCNDAASVARGNYLVFLNGETRVASDWLDELIGSFSIFPKAGMVGSKLLNYDGTLQEAGGICWRDGSAWNYGRNNDPDHPKYSYARRVDYCLGTSVAFPLKVWNHLSGFDDAYAPAGCEDVDIAFRLREYGYETWCQPFSCVLHYEGRGHEKDRHLGIQAYQVTNTRKLAERWKAILAHHAPHGQAPDREANRAVKERILVLDAVTPTPDQDSGSFITVRMMKALQELGFSVTFIPQGNYLHFGSYTEHLQRSGIECIYAPYFKGLDQFIADCVEFDYIIAYRYGVLFPVYRVLRERFPRARVVFHNVDLHYLREERQAELAGSRRGRILANETKRMELELVSEVDCTIVHTSVEAEVIRRQVDCDNIVEFPYIAECHYTDVCYAERHDVMFLGGYSHVPNVDAMQYFVGEIWPRLLKSLPSTSRLLIVGAMPPPVIQEMAGARIVVTGHVSDLSKYFDSARVFVAPLRYGAGIKGKVVQSLAYGTPAVVSPIAAEGIGVSDGQEVLIAEDREDFLNKIMNVFESQELWERLQKAGYDFVEKQFSWARCLEICNEVLDTADNHWIAKQDRALQRRIQAHLEN